ncbi:universal stress protein [Catellatospora coxensis]|uniref:Universal stress protein n=1 Tax=Catellatospora coxensis TaxID=310354 RepID=A0A8J3P813_9ACTN|nr:universal stress protein [Catellatospora coxensis]GIG07666.1 universal stress protein [Catellatospora coxensis]
MTNFRIVVGVDGSEGGRRALRWAVHEAAGRGGTVQAVAAWRWDETDDDVIGSAARDLTTDMLDRELGALPSFQREGVAIAGEVVEGRPADVLAAAAADADLLVLGSHGTSRLMHTVLGSVSEECIGKANCPVVVVPVGHELPHAADLAVPDPAG